MPLSVILFQAAFRHVDYDYVVNCAKIAKEANIPHMAYVSSERANSSSFFLYLKTKGEVIYENNL